VWSGPRPFVGTKVQPRQTILHIFGSEPLDTLIPICEATTSPSSPDAFSTKVG
jgi:hypothetical protein